MSKKYRPEIFKLQRSLIASDGVEKVLIYNRPRSIMGELPITESLRNLFPSEPIEGIGLPHKIFVRGRFNPDSTTIDIDQVADWQDW